MEHVSLILVIASATLAAQPKPSTGRIEGRVLNALTSEPIRKASVDLMTPNIAVWLTATTDAVGHFEFTAPPGTYKLSATHARFLEHSARRPITLREDERITDAEVRLPPQGVISGRVLDEDGDPMGTARVTLFKQVYLDGTKQWESAGELAANELGEYRYANLSSGRYIVRAYTQRPAASNNRYGEASPMRYTPAYHPNAPDEQSATAVLIAMGTDARDINIHLAKTAAPPSYRVSGKVTGAPAGGTILVYSSGSGGGQTTAQAPDYLFDLPVQSGIQTFRANDYSANPQAYAATNVNITGAMTGLVLNMNPAPTVTARVRLADGSSGASLKGIKVNLRRRPSLLNQTPGESDVNGVLFSATIAPSRYSIEIDTRTLPEGTFVQAVMAAGRAVSPSDFEILTSTQLDIIVSDRAGTITGTVTDENGKAFPYSNVTLIPVDDKLQPTKRAPDNEGNFTFTHLRPGKYKLFAWEEVDDLWQDPEFIKKHEGRTKEITVGPSETQTTQLRVIVLEQMR